MMRDSKQNFRGGAKRENHIETLSLFIHPLVDTVSLSSGIPSIYSRKTRTRLIRGGELPVNVKSLQYSRIMSRRRSHCNSRISGEEPAREPDSKRPVDVPISPRPRPSGPGVQCRPVQSSLITGLHHPMAGNSNRTGTAAAASQDRNSKTCQLDQPNARLSGRDLSQLPTLARQSCTPTRFLETSKKHIAGSFNLVWVPGSLSFHAVPAFPPFPSLRNIHLPRVETRTHLQNLRRKHRTDSVPHPPPSPKTSPTPPAMHPNGRTCVHHTIQSSTFPDRNHGGSIKRKRSQKKAPRALETRRSTLFRHSGWQVAAGPDNVRRLSLSLFLEVQVLRKCGSMSR